MSHVFHSVYGLRVRANMSIPGLTPEPRPSEIDLDVHLQDSAWPIGSGAERPDAPVLDEWTDESGDAGWRLWKVDDAYYRLRFADDTDFLIDAQGAEVWAAWKDPLTLEDTATYLLGPVLRRVLALRRVLCLHASAIVLDGRAIVLAGAPGSGKSTTAAAFAVRGVPVLTDDLVALLPDGDGFLVQPGYPLVRLWPDVSETVCGAPDALPRLTPNWDKRFLHLTGAAFAPAPVPLRAVYLLANGRADDAAPLVESVSARDALMGLVANSRSHAALDPSMLANEYRMLGRVRQAVAVRRLVPHESLNRLQRLCDVIENDVRTGSAAAPPGPESLVDAGALP